MIGNPVERGLGATLLERHTDYSLSDVMNGYNGTVFACTFEIFLVPHAPFSQLYRWADWVGKVFQYDGQYALR